IVSVGLVFGAIFGGELSKYLPFFASGVIIWAFMNGSLLEGCGVLAQAGVVIKSIPAPVALHIFRMLGRQVIVLAHHFTLFVTVWLIFRWNVGWGILLAVPGMVLMCLALMGAVLALAILCARFRDIQQIVATVLQLLFLLTPIVWMPGSLRASQAKLLLYGNPFYHLIEVVRGPLLGDPPAVEIWLGALISTALALGAGLMLYGRFRDRVPYWL